MVKVLYSLLWHHVVVTSTTDHIPIIHDLETPRVALNDCFYSVALALLRATSSSVGMD